MNMMTTVSRAVGQLFASRQAPTGAASSLGTELAVDRVLSVLMQAEDPDMLLQLVKIGRHDLRRLETDDEVWGALETRRDACINTPWRLEPGTGDVPTFLWELLEKWGQRMMSIAWSAMPYGYSVGEIVYRRDGERIVPAKIEEKPIEWFKIDKAGALRFVGVNNLVQAEGVPVDTQLKFLYTRHRPTYRQQYGEAILSRVYWPWYFRYNGWQFWGQFLERFGMPLLLGKVTNPKEWVQLMQQLGINSVVAVGKDSDVTAVTVQGQGQFDGFETACCKRIQKAILGQTLTTDTNGKGSYALGQVHELVRQDRRLADIRVVRDTMQRWINAFTALNFPGAQPPQFVLEDNRGLEAERAKRDADLANAGIVEFTEEYLLRTYDFEQGEIKIPDRTAAPANGGNRQATPPVKATKFARRRFTRTQQQIEQLAENALAEVDFPIDPKKLRGVVLAATSPEDLADRLATLMQDVDPAAFNEVLEQALFAADVIGYVHAEQGN